MKTIQFWSKIYIALKQEWPKKKKKSDLIYTFIGGLLYKSEIDDN